jgi:chloramphenicol 3-O phosphotransferase
MGVLHFDMRHDQVEIWPEHDLPIAASMGDGRARYSLLKGSPKMSSRIVLLNGVGSAGKSTIAKALQAIAAEPFLHVAMDSFLAMMPATYQEHPDGLSFETTIKAGKPHVHAKIGSVAERTLNGMRRAAAAMAAAGNNLILDEVLFGNVTTQHGNPMAEYRTLLAPYQFHTVGVFASLEVLESRERQRGDRTIGLARWQYSRVHTAMSYDLEINTDNAAPKECAQIIKDQFGL